MAYVESNGHVLDDVTCPFFLFVTHCVFHATFRIDKINWKYRKTANIIEKNFRLSHCYETSFLTNVSVIYAVIIVY